MMEDTIEKDAQLSAWPKAIAAITLFMEDMAAAKEFYQSVFGLPVFHEDEN